MAEDRVLPGPIADAYDGLLLRAQVEITKSLYWDEPDGWTFECILQAPYQNTEGIPREVMFRVVIPEEFPYAPVDVYSEYDDCRGLPHQEAETGKLCLYDERLAKRDASRLWTYLNWTQEWLCAAADGSLLKNGDPYELPDFGIDPVSYATITEPLLFEEDANSFTSWEPFIGHTGMVKLARGDAVRGILPIEFSSITGNTIRPLEWNARILSDSTLLGRWLLLPDVRFERHRPPYTFGELKQLCSRYDIDLTSILERSWRVNKHNDWGIVLVGFPIPKLVGGEPQEIHWQPLTFPNKRAARVKLPGRKAQFKTFGFQKKFAPEARLPWGLSENCSQTRFSSRGSFSAKLCRFKVALLGCGALGSYVAESLVRGGVSNIALYDADIVQYGNLGRHRLTASDLYTNKAEALARFLDSVALLGNVRSYAESVPQGLTSGGKAAEDLLDADLLIDCTADETASEWLSRYAFEHEKQLVSLFVNAESAFLTVYGSGQARSSYSVYEEAMTRVENNETPVPRDQYSKEDASMIRDVGCWHPTFPAQNNHIEALASAALDMISYEVQKGHDKGWIAILHRIESSVPTALRPQTMVELTWKTEYS